MSIIIIIIIIFLCTVNGKGEWSLHDLEVGEVQNLHKISNVGGCQLREKLARGGNWAMFRFKAVGTIARFSGRGPCGSIIIIIIMISYAKPSEILYVLCFPLKSPNSPFCLPMFTHGPSWVHGLWSSRRWVHGINTNTLIHSKYFHHQFMIITRDHS